MIYDNLNPAQIERDKVLENIMGCYFGWRRDKTEKGEGARVALTSVVLALGFTQQEALNRLHEFERMFPDNEKRHLGAFTDEYGQHVQPGDFVEYNIPGLIGFKPRRGILMEALQDGDAVVHFSDNLKAETVKWSKLKLVARGDDR